MGTLVLSMPVFHKGYADFFNRLGESVDCIYLFSDELIDELSEYRPDIASLSSEILVGILRGLGYSRVSILKRDEIKNIKGKDIVLVDDQISRAFREKYLLGADVRWEKVFLRWEREKVLSTEAVNVETVSDEAAIYFMEAAYKEGEKSSDWWRQVGAVLVKNDEIILRGYNVGVPDDHEPYKRGAIRDFLEPGERPELSSTIHGEQSIIAAAAKEGRALEGADLYVTHFPCAVCAKLLSRSGIRACYFGEGSSNLDGEAALKSAGIGIFLVKRSESDTIKESK